jgi:hypothetical protein
MHKNNFFIKTMSVRTNIRKKHFVVDPATKLSKQTLRHDFGEKFMEELKYFATLHKFDDRKVFKEAWNVWANQDSIKMQIDEEVKQLQNDGYKGDVLDKMFKSARYYFRKKQEKTEQEKKEGSARKQYVSLCPRFLEQIDIFIVDLLKSEAYSPASAYEEFCKNKKELIITQVDILILNMEPDEICIKLKKTFKNRFHTLMGELRIQRS